jgi:pilus assembly protein Flp/PilA
MNSRFLAFIAEEDAPTMIEYALMLALVALVAISAVGAFGTNVTELFYIPPSVF